MGWFWIALGALLVAGNVVLTLEGRGYPGALLGRGVTSQSASWSCNGVVGALLALSALRLYADNSVIVQRVRAAQLTKRRRYSEALAACDRALALDPIHVIV
jgi:drug/metabolite transporter (DMT)-like permease